MLTEKLYDNDAYLREFTATVLRCDPLTDEQIQETGAAYGVILDRTAFFPEGGGQSGDTGNLHNSNVLDVREINGEIVHFTDIPLDISTVVLGTLDWKPRLRKMQNHTGEHLVSGIVHAQFGWDNVGFHLGEDGVTVDFSGPLSAEDLAMVEYLANRAVAENVPVRAHYPAPEILAKMDYRSKLDNLENVRIVTIEGWDVCACCAPHVSATGAIGAVKILGCENWKGGVRLRMLCGLDAVDDYSKRLEITTRISNLLSAKQLECAEAVERLLETQQSDREEIARLKKALVDCKAAALDPTDGDLLIFDNTLDPVSLRNLVNAGMPLAEGVCAAFSGNDEDGYRYIIGSAHGDLRTWAKAFNSALSGRGGGTYEMIQGTVKATADQICAYFSGTQAV